MNCRLCGSQELKTLYRSQRYSFEVIRCRGCKLISVENPPAEDTLREMYSDAESTLHFSGAMHNDKVRQRHQQVLIDITALLSNTDRHVAGSSLRLFDIGAGTGDFLNEAREAGFEVSGNEFSTAAIRLAWERYHIQLDSRSLSQDDRNGFFDVVTMWGLLEHVLDPLDVLTQAMRLLRPGGVLYIYTPAWCMYDRLGLISARAMHWTRLLDRRITTAHLQLFPRSTLKWACEYIGLQVQKMDVVCEYNLPVAAYLESLGVPSRMRKTFSWIVDQLIDRNLFFRNNSRVFCRKSDKGS